MAVGWYLSHIMPRDFAYSFHFLERGATRPLFKTPYHDPHVLVEALLPAASPFRPVPRHGNGRPRRVRGHRGEVVRKLVRRGTAPRGDMGRG
jgi:hypothetical protein